eukprot:CAMPEP_0194206218 /NCGR_PEP_ID=MMETSP0156-20130528/5304_1 /TAXON_ID=33649 /ORGANISM="Thalassionema nitzschioides, Strain L26-B" /LENGTH=125 /DNA_ID=CAMNT_0038932681 /DNA_START=30 /DNA_END=407 /DNA_ORIENTATION=-
MAVISRRQAEREERALTPPSKTMDAGEHAQRLVQTVRKVIEFRLGSTKTLEATQMITRTFTNEPRSRLFDKLDPGRIYFIKVKTSNKKWPWIFVKIYEPPLVTNVFKVKFRDMKKMDQEYALISW